MRKKLVDTSKPAGEHHSGALLTGGAVVSQNINGEGSSSAADGIKPETADPGYEDAIIKARELERHRLAIDLHDGLGQELSFIKFLISAVMKSVVSPQLRVKLEEANRRLADIHSQIRTICYLLDPAGLEEFGLVQAIMDLAGRVRQAGLIRIAVQEDLFPRLTSGMEVDMFRVIQEFMSNAIRHGGATRLLIRLESKGPEILIFLQDNGKGFDPGAISGAGLGLRSMYNRIQSHGGFFSLSSGPEKGTSAKIRILYR